MLHGVRLLLLAGWAACGCGYGEDFALPPDKNGLLLGTAALCVKGRGVHQEEKCNSFGDKNAAAKDGQHRRSSENSRLVVGNGQKMVCTILFSAPHRRPQVFTLGRDTVKTRPEREEEPKERTLADRIQNCFYHHLHLVLACKRSRR